MPSAEADIRASLDAMIDDVDTSQRVFGWVAGAISDLARETRTLTRAFEDRLDLVEQRFDEVDGLVARSGQRLEYRLDSHLDRLESLRKRVELGYEHSLRQDQKEA